VNPKVLPAHGSLRYTKSRALAEQRLHSMVGGVNGDGRTDYPFPIIFSSAHGALLKDVDGNEYVDLHGGYGTAVLGYSNPAVERAVLDRLTKSGTFVGVAHEYEGLLSQRLCDLLPEAERVALCGGGGTDALYHAVRLARAFTGRSRVIKVEGGYHGWHGDLGVSTRPSPSALGITPTDLAAGTGLYDRLPPSVPNSAGILEAVTGALVVVPANDPEALASRVAELGEELAAIVLEPVLFSIGTVDVDLDYLAAARRLADEADALLIFDEVLSGFRCRLGGVGAGRGVIADIGAYGKAVANGHVLSFLAGRSEVMEFLSPSGPAFYSGTFNGHIAGVTAALATIEEVSSPGFYERLGDTTAGLAKAINRRIDALGLTGCAQAVGSGFTVYFGTRAVRNYRDLAASLTPEVEEMNTRFRWFLRDHGVFMQHRAGTNRCFLSSAHTPEQIDQIEAAIAMFLEEYAESAQ
jgi:glutamate-1-semialdehyde 2,1-aminomutase